MFAVIVTLTNAFDPNDLNPIARDCVRDCLGVPACVASCEAERYASVPTVSYQDLFNFAKEVGDCTFRCGKNEEDIIIKLTETCGNSSSSPSDMASSAYLVVTDEKDVIVAIEDQTGCRGLRNSSLLTIITTDQVSPAIYDGDNELLRHSVKAVVYGVKQNNPEIFYIANTIIVCERVCSSAHLAGHNLTILFLLIIFSIFLK